VRELAEVVAQVFEVSDLTIGERGGDNRSYRVSFDKIQEVLPEFEPQWDVRAGATEMRNVFKAADLTREAFEGLSSCACAGSKSCSRAGRSTSRSTGPPPRRVRKRR